MSLEIKTKVLEKEKGKQEPDKKDVADKRRRPGNPQQPMQR